MAVARGTVGRTATTSMAIELHSRPLVLAAVLAAGVLCSGSGCENLPRLGDDAGVPTHDAGADAGAPDGGTPPADGGLPATGACALLNLRRCEYLQRCGLIDVDPASLRTCLSYFAATWCGPSLWPALVEVGTLRFDPALAQACADGFVGRSCEVWSEEPSACSRFLGPNRYLGQACYGAHDECRDGVCRGFSCPRACSLPGQPNDACDEDSDCRVDAGLYCQLPATANTGTCVARGRIGSDCDSDHRCSPELFCNNQTPSRCETRRSDREQCLSTADCLPAYWCHVTPSDGGICIGRADADAGCTDDDQCRPGLLCQTLTRRCESVGPLPDGGACSLRQTCALGNTCVGATAQSLGKCLGPLGPGQPCISSGDCRADLACASPDGGRKTCGPRQPDGHPCILSRDCRVFAECAVGTCVELPAPGEPCLRQRCLYGACQAHADGGGVCLGLGGPGARCLVDAECSSGRCLSGRCASACTP